MFKEYTIEKQNAKSLILAGKSLFTIQNEKSSNRFTYSIKKLKDKDVWFVKVLSGNNNETDYRYIGFISGDYFKTSPKALVKPSALSFIAFDWLFNKYLLDDKNNDNIKLYHNGSCAKCGRILTTPESIKAGIGPECSKNKNEKFKIFSY